MNLHDIEFGKGFLDLFTQKARAKKKRLKNVLKNKKVYVIQTLFF